MSMSTVVDFDVDVSFPENSPLVLKNAQNILLYSLFFMLYPLNIAVILDLIRPFLSTHSLAAIFFTNIL